MPALRPALLHQTLPYHPASPTLPSNPLMMPSQLMPPLGLARDHPCPASSSPALPPGLRHSCLRACCIRLYGPFIALPTYPCNQPCTNALLRSAPPQTLRRSVTHPCLAPALPALLSRLLHGCFESCCVHCQAVFLSHQLGQVNREPECVPQQECIWTTDQTTLRMQTTAVQDGVPSSLAVSWVRSIRSQMCQQQERIRSTDQTTLHRQPNTHRQTQRETGDAPDSQNCQLLKIMSRHHSSRKAKELPMRPPSALNMQKTDPNSRRKQLRQV